MIDTRCDFIALTTLEPREGLPKVNLPSLPKVNLPSGSRGCQKSEPFKQRFQSELRQGRAVFSSDGCELNQTMSNGYITVICSGSEVESYSRLTDFVYHSALGLSVIKKKRKKLSQFWYRTARF